MYIPGFFPMASALLNRTLHSGLQTPVVEKVASNLWDSANKRCVCFVCVHVAVTELSE